MPHSAVQTFGRYQLSTYVLPAAALRAGPGRLAGDQLGRKDPRREDVDLWALGTCRHI